MLALAENNGRVEGPIRLRSMLFKPMDGPRHKPGHQLLRGRHRQVIFATRLVDASHGILHERARIGDMHIKDAKLGVRNSVLDCPQQHDMKPWSVKAGLRKIRYERR
jgi:hypothetical protein